MPGGTSKSCGKHHGLLEKRVSRNRSESEQRDEARLESDAWLGLTIEFSVWLGFNLDLKRSRILLKKVFREALCESHGVF